MKIYSTQYNVVRKLNTLFSSYTYVNNLIKIVISNQ